MSRFKKMNAEIKKLWVAALRGGKYNQAEGVLFDGENGYCCLGVLQRIVDPENLDTPHGEYGHKGENGVPTPVCLKTAGMARYRPSSSGVINLLIGLNDDEGKTFPEIADFIEQNL